MHSYPLVPDSAWDHTHVWQNANDRVSFQRMATEGPYEQQQIARAKLTADPGTPAATIRQNVPVVPPRFGYPIDELGIQDIVSDQFDRTNDRAPTDFSGKVSGYQGTSYPSLQMW